MEAAVHPISAREAPDLSANSGLIAALTLLVGTLALCFDRVYNGDLYLQLASGRFVSQHGFVAQDPFPTIAQGGQWLNQQWLSEVAFFHTAAMIGLGGLSILYAGLLALPLALLLWLCRRKGSLMLCGIAVLYFPGLLGVIHPRAAGFSLLIFSLLVVLLTLAWRAHPAGDRGRRQIIAVVAILALFGLWANLHGGFVAGLLLIGLVSAGAAIDRCRGLPDAVPLHRVGVLGSIGLLAVPIVTLATPLGGQIWRYLLSFRNEAISLGSQEWGSAFQSKPALLYIGAAAAFAVFVWLRSPAPRRATSLLVGAGFVAFALIAIRNILFIGPTVALLVAWSAPDRDPIRLRRPVALVSLAVPLAGVVLAVILGPPKADPQLRSPLMEYALAHPPEHGRILGYAGIGSYILWRSPDTPVVLDGWLEHFSRADLHANYGILRGWIGDLPDQAKRLQVGAVIARDPKAIRRLMADGYRPEFREQGVGTYLVRRGPRGPRQRSRSSSTVGRRKARRVSAPETPTAANTRPTTAPK